MLFPTGTPAGVLEYMEAATIVRISKKETTTGQELSLLRFSLGLQLAGVWGALLARDYAAFQKGNVPNEEIELRWGKLVISFSLPTTAPRGKVGGNARNLGAGRSRGNLARDFWPFGFLPLLFLNGRPGPLSRPLRNRGGNKPKNRKSRGVGI